MTDRNWTLILPLWEWCLSVTGLSSVLGKILFFLSFFFLQQSRFKKFQEEIFPFLVMLDIMRHLELDDDN